MKLVLFRHCQTTYNRSHRFTGTIDVGLTVKGRGQAKQLMRHLCKEVPDIIFSSPLHRCMDTADIVRGDRDVAIMAVQDLRERSYGDLQGTTHAAYKRRYGADALHNVRRSYDTAPPHGESLKQVEARVVAWYKGMLKSGYSEVWVCMHGNVLRMLRKHLEGLTVQETLALEHPYNVVYEYNVKI